MRPVPLFPAAIAAAAMLSACSKPPPESAGAHQRPPQPVEVTTPKRATLRDTLSLVGSIQANESAEVRAETTGLIREILFEEGEAVEAGATLALIDDRELQAQLAQTEAQLALARQTLDRTKRLVESNAIADAELDAAVAELAQLEASERLLKVRLSKTRIEAPFAGTLGARLLSPGDLIDPTQPLTTLVDTSRLKVSFTVPERYYPQVEVGDTVLVETRPGETANASVYFVSRTIDPNTRSGLVKAWLEDPAKSLRPGMFTPVELVLAVHENVLTVPEGAILTSGRGDVLVTVEGEKGRTTANFVPVRTDLRTLGRVEVTPMQPGSLDEDTRIVAAGVGAIIVFPGAPVAPQPMQPLPEKLGSTMKESKEPKEPAPRQPAATPAPGRDA